MNPETVKLLLMLSYAVAVGVVCAFVLLKVTQFCQAKQLLLLKIPVV